MTDKNFVHSAISAIMDEIKALETDKKVDKGGNYGYISSDKILSRVGEAMVRHGLTITPSCSNQKVTVHEWTDNYGKSKRMYLAEIDMAFQICSIEGDCITATWLGSGTDYTVPDKALYKAMTSGHKYFLMKLFCIGVGNEDSEHETHEDDKGVVSSRQTSTTTTKRTTNTGGKSNSDAPKQATIDAYRALCQRAYELDVPFTKFSAISTESAMRKAGTELRKLVDAKKPSELDKAFPRDKNGAPIMAGVQQGMPA